VVHVKQSIRCVCVHVSGQITFQLNDSYLHIWHDDLTKPILVKQGVALRDVTLLARRVLPLVSYVAYASVTDDARRQRPLLIWTFYTMYRRASNITKDGHVIVHGRSSFFCCGCRRCFDK